MKTKNSAYHHGELRQALLETGRKLLEKNGAENLSIRNVAAETGVSHNAPYRHFKDKNELLAAIACDGFERLDSAMKSALDRHPDSIRDQIYGMAAAYVRLALANPETSKLMFSGYIRLHEYPEAGAVADRSYATVKSVIQNGRQSGFLGERDTETYAATLWAAIHGLSTLLQAENFRNEQEMEMTVRHVVTTVIETILEGMLRDSRTCS